MWHLTNQLWASFFPLIHQCQPLGQQCDELERETECQDTARLQTPNMIQASKTNKQNHDWGSDVNMKTQTQKSLGWRDNWDIVLKKMQLKTETFQVLMWFHIIWCVYITTLSWHDSPSRSVCQNKIWTLTHPRSQPLEISHTLQVTHCQPWVNSAVRTKLQVV